MAKKTKTDDVPRCPYCGRKAVVMAGGSPFQNSPLEWQVYCSNERCHVRPRTIWASKRATAIRWFTQTKF